MEQKHYQFAPGALPIQTGTAVEFPNLDDGYHNVYRLKIIWALRIWRRFFQAFPYV